MMPWIFGLLSNLGVVGLAAFLVWLGVGLLGNHNGAAWFLMVSGVLLALLGMHSIESTKKTRT